MAASDTAYTEADCIFHTVAGYLMPFYLAGARGDTKLAQITIVSILRAYQAATPYELELAGRIIALNAAATDSLGRSMRPGLSDTMVLRYRNNALALTRTANKCQAELEAIQQPLSEPEVAVPQPSQSTAASKARSHPFATMAQELHVMQAAAAVAIRNEPPGAQVAGQSP